MTDETYPDIVESVQLTDIHKSVTDRYYSKRYYLKANDIENNDYCLLFHSNRICVLTLAPSHMFFKQEGDFKINFTPGQVDRTKNKVSGKGKKGGQTLEANSKVCSIEFVNGTNLTVLSCMKGKLIEVNERLLQNPKLLRDRPDSDGYIAIMLSAIGASDKLKSELINEEQYKIAKKEN